MKAIGIDLGTTNSVAAYCDPGRRNVRVLSNGVGENLTPSVVSVKRPRRSGEPAETLVGRAALNYGPSAPEDTILSIKRLMGRNYAEPEVRDISDRFNYRVVPGPGEDPRAHVRLNGTVRTPAEVSALILQKIKEDASRSLGEEVTHAVITVPAYFEGAQRAATREAGERAGLVVKKIIDEPTAAAIAFGFQADSDARHRILVYDLGGGTFDISLVQMVKDREGRNQFQGLQIEGDNWLGGDNFDRHIVDKIVAWVQQETHEDPLKDKRFLFLAKKAAEEAKRALSQAASTDVDIPAAYRTSQGTFVDVGLPLSQAELEGMIRPEVERSMTLVAKALGNQNLSPDDITDVLLVGGATLTPLVQKMIEGVFGAAKVRRNVNPMECVALGAAILAATLRGLECPRCGTENDESLAECGHCGHNLASARSVGDTGVGEVTAKSLGIAAVKGTRSDVFAPIIPKGTAYPLREPMKRRFQAISGRRIVVPVYEGDHPVASRNSPQGVIEYDLPQEIESNSQVEVSFNYDRNRTLTVTITVPGTDLLKTETLRHDLPSSAPPASETEESVEETTWRDELADTIEFARRFLIHYRTYMDTAEGAKLQRDLERAHQVISFSDDVEGLRTKRQLEMDIVDSSVATQLFLADRAAEGAPPEEARMLREAARTVRDSYERGDRERGMEQARLLKVLVARTLERAGIKEIADQEDYGGLLRLLGA
jgi:molecular chaperone DnaK (HSP70)